jgi:hypothetical protein
MRKTFTFVAGVAWLLTSQASIALAQTSGSERMVIESRLAEPTRVEATGAVVDRGTVADHLVLDPFTGAFSNHAVMTLSAGTLEFEDHGTAQLTVDPKSCVGTGHFVAPFSVTSGTGAYTGANGDGTVIGDLKFIFDRTADGCSHFPVRSWGIARATGNIDVA